MNHEVWWRVNRFSDVLQKKTRQDKALHVAAGNPPCCHLCLDASCAPSAGMLESHPATLKSYKQSQPDMTWYDACKTAVQQSCSVHPGFKPSVLRASIPAVMAFISPWQFQQSRLTLRGLRWSKQEFHRIPKALFDGFDEFELWGVEYSQVIKTK